MRKNRLFFLSAYLQICLCIVFVVLLEPGCSDSANESEQGAGRLAFRLDWKDESVTLRSLKAETGDIDCEDIGIDRIRVELEGYPINGLWPCADHAGILEDVPPDENHTILAYGVDENGKEIYFGKADHVIVTSGETTDVGTIDMYPALSIDAAQLTYRTGVDSDEFFGWIELSKPGGVYESDISAVQLVGPAGENVGISKTVLEHSGWAYHAVWDPAAQTHLFSGPTQKSGLRLRFSDGDMASSGNYTVKLDSVIGQTHEYVFYFPGITQLPVTEKEQMHFGWDKGTLYLEWTLPFAGFDHQTVIFSRIDGQPFFYADIPPEFQSLTLEKEWVEILKGHESGAFIEWVHQTNLVTGDGMNYAQAQSMAVEIPWVDNVAPQLLKSQCTPPNGAIVNLNQTHRFRLVFSEKMNGDILMAITPEIKVGWSTQWNAEQTALTFLFEDDIEDGVYSIVLNPSAISGDKFQDLTGNDLDNDVVYTFEHNSDMLNVDYDGDGFTVLEGDCNNSDNTIFPGANEVCGDDIDQDCDGNDRICQATSR